MVLMFEFFSMHLSMLIDFPVERDVYSMILIENKKIYENHIRYLNRLPNECNRLRDYLQYPELLDLTQISINWKCIAKQIITFQLYHEGLLKHESTNPLVSNSLSIDFH